MKLFLFLSLLCFEAMAYVDLGVNYSYSIRKVKGLETDENPSPGLAETTSKQAGVTWAWYIWDYSALELSYSSQEERLFDTREVGTKDSSITIKEIDSTVLTIISGVGLRQAFASRSARIIPSLALGYAKYTTSGSTQYLITNGVVDEKVEIEQERQVFSSSYVAFAIRFKFTELMGLTVSAKSVMPDFKTDTISDNVTYSAGLSWVF